MKKLLILLFCFPYLFPLSAQTQSNKINDLLYVRSGVNIIGPQYTGPFTNGFFYRAGYSIAAGYEFKASKHFRIGFAGAFHNSRFAGKYNLWTNDTIGNIPASRSYYITFKKPLWQLGITGRYFPGSGPIYILGEAGIAGRFNEPKVPTMQTGVGFGLDLKIKHTDLRFFAQPVFRYFFWGKELRYKNLFAGTFEMGLSTHNLFKSARTFSRK